MEREPQVGGSCLLSGTIPSKALREQALRYRRMQGSASSLAVELRGDAPLSALLHGVDAVIAAQDRYLQAQLARNQVDLIRGRGAFLGANRIEVQRLDGFAQGGRVAASAARDGVETEACGGHRSGSRAHPRQRFDSEPAYIPRSMLVLGSGVIACEYASIFAALGCAVTVLDKAAEPLGFLDPPLRAGFLAAFRAMGGVYRGGAEVEGARFDGFSQVQCSSRAGMGWPPTSCSPPSPASPIWTASVSTGSNSPSAAAGMCRWTRDSRPIFPAFSRPAMRSVPRRSACAAADQGRRAALAALGLPPPPNTSLVPSGVYTIPEIACVGLSQSEAAAKKIDLIVGRADFSEVARAHIAGEPAGFLTLLCDRGTGRVLGVQVLGKAPPKLVHLGQAAIATGASADFFIEQIFNFPTMTEAYRIAAFDVLKQRSLPQAAPLKLAAAAR